MPSTITPCSPTSSVDVFGELGDVADVGRVDPAAHRRQRDGAVHRPGVEVLQPEARAASARATVLFPAPAGPSMAMTRTYQLVPSGIPSL